MTDKEYIENKALRNELEKAVNKTVKQEIEIIRLNLLVENLRGSTKAMGNEKTGSEYGSLSFPGENKLNPTAVADALSVAIDTNARGIRDKIKEV